MQTLGKTCIHIIVRIIMYGMYVLTDGLKRSELFATARALRKLVSSGPHVLHSCCFGLELFVAFWTTPSLVFGRLIVVISQQAILNALMRSILVVLLDSGLRKEISVTLVAYPEVRLSDLPELCQHERMTDTTPVGVTIRTQVEIGNRLWHIHCPAADGPRIASVTRKAPLDFPCRFNLGLRRIRLLRLAPSGGALPWLPVQQHSG